MSTSFKTSPILAAAIAITFTAAAAQAAPAHAPTNATATARSLSSAPMPNGGLPMLFNQTGSPSFEGILAMTNLDPGQETFDTELADDFNVPAGGWAVSVVRIGSFYHSGGTPVRPSTSGNVTFYVDTGIGRPGAVISGCAFKDVPLYYSEIYLTSVINLPEVCALPEGRYWMGFSGNLSFADQEGGVYVTQESSSPDNMLVWRNPLGGYATACTNWAAPTSCGLAGNGGMTFQLYGQTTPVTLQAFSVE